MYPAGRGTVIVIAGLLLASMLPAPALAVDPSYLDFYWSYDQVTDELRFLADQYPHIVSLISIGTTIEDREIWAVKVSDNPAEDEDEPEVLLTGAHHAKEWPGLEVVMATLTLLVESYDALGQDNDGDGAIDEDPFDGLDNDADGTVDEDWSEARITWLVDNREIWIVPIVNPDGLEYCRGQVASGESDEANLWRKNREPNYADFNPLKGLTYGVDLNRNYGFHWGELGAQSHVNSAAEDYIGPLDKRDDDGDRRLNEDPMDNQDNDGDGLNAAETKAVQAFVADHEFTIALNFHTFKGTIYWPWMFTLQLPEDEDTFMRIAVGMNTFNGYDYRDMSERNQQALSRHPPVDGDSNEWMYGKHGIIAYTIELGYNMFIPGEEELAGIVAENLGANLIVIEEADHPRREPLSLNHTALENTTHTGSRDVIVRVGGGELVPGGLVLHFRVDGGEWSEAGMVPSTEGYTASIPGAEPGQEVEYYIEARSVDRGTTMLPSYGPFDLFAYRVEGSTSGAASAVLPAVLILLVVLVAFVQRKRVIHISRRLLRRAGITPTP